MVVRTLEASALRPLTWTGTILARQAAASLGGSQVAKGSGSQITRRMGGYPQRSSESVLKQ